MDEKKVLSNGEKHGGYSGSRDASEIKPPEPIPSGFVRPNNDVPARPAK